MLPLFVKLSPRITYIEINKKALKCKLYIYGKIHKTRTQTID